MADELLDGTDVGAGIEQLADKRAAQVVRGEAGDAGLVGEKVQAQEDGLGGHGPVLNVVGLVDGVEQRARREAAASDPGVDGLAAADGAVDDALLAALAGTHGDLAVVVVVEQQRDGLAAA